MDEFNDMMTSIDEYMETGLSDIFRVKLLPKKYSAWVSRDPIFAYEV